jgi:hypothetical protein
MPEGIETSLLVEVQVGSVNGCMAIGEQRFLLPDKRVVGDAGSFEVRVRHEKDVEL